MGIRKIENLEQFHEVVNSDKPTFVQFSAEWCGPCQAIEGNMQEFAQKYHEKITFIYMDADEFEDFFMVN